MPGGETGSPPGQHPSSRSIGRSVSSHLETAFMSQNARKHSVVLALVLCTTELHYTWAHMLWFQCITYVLLHSVPRSSKSVAACTLKSVLGTTAAVTSLVTEMALLQQNHGVNAVRNASGGEASQC